MPQNQSPQKSPVFKYLLWAIVGIGIAIRLFHLIDNRSLWEDEVYLSTGIVHYNYHQLATQPMPYQQKAPLGYLYVVKTFTYLLGNTEIALRLFSFICGVLSLIIFIQVAKFFLKPGGVIAAVAIMAFSPIILYHGVEAKQYAVEAFGTVLLLYLYIKYHTKNSLKQQLIWGLWGAVIVWFSFASVFILAAIAFTVTVIQLFQRRYTTLIGSFRIYALWFGSFLVNYILFSGKDADTGWLIFFFETHEGFMPLSAGAIKWIAERMVSFLNYPMGLSWFNVYNLSSVMNQAMQRMIFVPLVLAAAGVYYLYGKNRWLLIFIVSCFAIVMAASTVKLYPFHERLTLFLAPVFILLLGAGCDLFAGTNNTSKMVQAMLILLLLFGPVKNTFNQLLNPYLFGDYKKSYQREALLYMKAHYKPGDAIYVYWNDLPGYRLYKDLADLPVAIEGKDYRHQSKSFNEYFNHLDKDLLALKGRKRVWIIQNNHINIPVGDYIGDPEWFYNKGDGPELFYKHVLTLGKEVDTYKPEDKRAVSDINVSLMDFTNN
ncbi:glycosyltransferase family 39 protein [Mucilaginibacter limnophilus]|uniref:Glycosyltransferase family 39 protein n=1 Tax=Mucilaginibacter limnophilus TaxID=1932778 RepID=A0A437MVC4_9SPHI|nr:glycosyltransferase family 39 protein [Mucilaginibacter limnophilus]RVU01609.1 glycosyltransferase family 39 protein [Mucilaginibacter limnophilus]